MKVIQVVKREALFIKAKDLEPQVAKRLLQNYSILFFEEKACAQCEFRLDKENMPKGEVCDLCANCAAFKGGHKLAVKVTVGKNKYIRTPIGDITNLVPYLANKGYSVKFKNKNPHIPIKRFKFTGTLKDHQIKSVEVLSEKKRGILKAPPRSGKTVVSAGLVAALSLKTIIIASQRDWLVGFLETFIGSKTQIPLTNLAPERIGFAKKLADFDKYDICLCTVQTFWSEMGQKLLAKIRDLFSVVIYDEVHTSAAPKYSMVASRLNVEYSIGLSGTPSRKDGKIIITNKLIGPVIHKVFVERLQPIVKLTRTGYTKKYAGQVPWVRMVSALEKDKKRIELIADWALKDMAAGHLVLIPFTQIKPIQMLIETINRKAGKKVAHPFYGAIKKEVRDLTIERARNYKIKILVGNTKLLSTGINIPRASCLYDVTMSSNLENCEQRVSRILTVWDDKPTPMMRIFLDDMNVRKRCLSNEWWRCVAPKFKPVLSERDDIALKSYFKDTGSRGFSGHEL